MGRPLSAKNKSIEHEQKREFHFSPFGTNKSKEKEIKAKISRDRKEKNAKISEFKE